MQISNNIFWDNDIDKLDYTNNLFIERILNFWEIKDYKELKKKIWEQKIKDYISKNYQNLDKKSLNFWSKILNLNIKNNNPTMYEQLNTPIFRRNFR